MRSVEFFVAAAIARVRNLCGQRRVIPKTTPKTSAIWVRHRAGELKDVMRDAVAQAEKSGLNVLHVEIESGALA